MRDGWQVVTLGAVCNISRGTSPTQKTPPGPYPLIVTGPQPLSSETFQFEGEAVCVPLVSSTGHGHASLKRVHLARGKFAVANIIAACSPRNAEELKARYLFLYLQHFKDAEIVTRMKGTANVSLSIANLASVPVILPPLDEQERITDLMAGVDDAIEAAEAEKDQFDSVRASQGSAEYARDERSELRELGNTLTGATPATGRPDYWQGGEVPFITPGDLDFRGIMLSGASRAVSAGGAASTRRLLDPWAVVQTCIGATFGKVAYTGVAALTNQQINALQLANSVDAAYAALALASPIGQAAIASRAASSTMPIVNKRAWSQISIPWPDLESRRRVVRVAQGLEEAADAAFATAEALRALRSNLLTVLLTGAHEIPSSYDTLLKGDAA